MLGLPRSRAIAIGILSASRVACSSGGASDAGTMDVATYDGLPPLDVVLADTADAALDAGPPPQWTCPAGWVASQRGGCGPAVVLCPDPNGATAGACSGLDLRRPGRGAFGNPFFLLAGDGGVGGGWNAGPGAPDGGAGCASGWTSNIDGTCDGSLRSDCPIGTGALPGGGCTATSPGDCPGAPYADPGPEALGATIVHVSAHADASVADGSITFPFATIASGIARAGAGGWVAVAAGSYAETLTLTSDVHVFGVCAAQTMLTGSGDPWVTVNGAANVTLSGVTLSGSGAAVRTTAGATLALTRVRVDHANGVGVDVRGVGTTLSAQDLVITATGPASGGDPGTGLWVREGASATVTRLFHAGNQGGVLVTGGGSYLALTGSTLRDAQPRVDAVSSAGLVVANGGAANVSGTVVISNLGQGVVVTDPGSRIDIEDSWVRDTLPLSTAQPGTGIVVMNSATMQISRVRVSAARSTGVDVHGGGAIAWLLGTAVNGTLPAVTGGGGTGLFAGSGGVLHATDVLVSQSVEEGLAAASGQMILSDVLVQGVAPSLRGLGLGVVAAGAGRVTGERVAVTGSSGVAVAAADLGLAVTRQGGTVQLTNVFVDGVNASPVQVLGTASRNAREVAYGLFSAPGATLDLDHAVVQDGALGMFATGGLLRVVTGVVTGERRLGALSGQGVQTPPVLTGVYTIGNADDSIGVDTTLPEVVLGE